MKDPIKIVFAPGCFDSFEGSQEELDKLIAEIQRMADSGELFEKSKAIDFDEVIDEDPEFAEQILRAINDEDNISDRKLN